MKHMCDYCCWYVSMERGCEAPSQMRERACEEAMKRKDDAERVKSKQSKKMSYKNEIIRLLQNCMFLV